MINWEIHPLDEEIVDDIVERAEELGLVDERMDAIMDITAAHCNGCELKLAELLAAADIDFIHDVTGIFNHVDRDTGELTDCFVPRFAA